MRTIPALFLIREIRFSCPSSAPLREEKYPNGQPKAANYIDKVVTIQNTGKSAAWIRAYYAVPSDLDDGYETFNAGANILHGNFGNKIVDGTVYTTFGAEWNWMHDGKWNYFETTMDGVSYNVYFADYYQPVRPMRPPTAHFAACIWTRTWI